MAAENCSSSLLLDPFWSGGHWGPSTTDLLAFETDALARALGASMLPNPAAAVSAVDTTPSSSSRSSAFFPCSPSPTASNASTFTTTGATTPASSSAGSPFSASRSASPRPPRPQPGAVAAGRISKRKPRRSPPSSKRAPISYIETDPARFREMVQQMTGIGMPPSQPPAPLPMPMHSYRPSMAMMQMSGPPQVQAAMPTLDTSAGFVVDTVAVQLQQHNHHQEQILSAPGILDNSFALFLSDFDCGDELLMNIPDFAQQQQIQQRQQQEPLPPCFPTLESWSD